MGRPAEYIAGSTRLLSVQFLDATGQPFDPLGVELRIKPPGDAAVQVYENPANPEEGTFTQQVDIPLTESSVGTWHVRWSGTGVAQEWYFWVQRSLFMG